MIAPVKTARETKCYSSALAYMNGGKSYWEE
jgi:hypothetical protein